MKSRISSRKSPHFIENVLVGLVATKGGAKGIHDDLLLKELKNQGKVVVCT
jgi:hypothetical protein